MRVPALYSGVRVFICLFYLPHLFQRDTEGEMRPQAITETLPRDLRATSECFGVQGQTFGYTL